MTLPFRPSRLDAYCAARVAIEGLLGEGPQPLAAILALVEPRPFEPEDLSAALSAMLTSGYLEMDSNRHVRVARSDGR